MSDLLDRDAAIRALDTAFAESGVYGSLLSDEIKRRFAGLLKALPLAAPATEPRKRFGRGLVGGKFVDEYPPAAPVAPPAPLGLPTITRSPDALTGAEEDELDDILATLLLPETFTGRERYIARKSARLMFKLLTAKFAARLDAEAQPPTGNWQPMDTAEQFKTGPVVHILLCIERSYYAHGNYGTVEMVTKAHWAHGDGDGMMPPFGPAWFESDRCGGYQEVLGKITGWLPLPPTETKA
jgi:hypothetical protein